MDKETPSGTLERHSGDAEERAFVELARTSDFLTRQVAEVLKEGSLSLAQYNVLRILRGSKSGLTCGEIASRLITRDPDITRLHDRMEKRGLISRSRDAKDRRVVLTRITPDGLKVLARLDGPVRQAHRRLLGHLGRAKLETLQGLLRAVRKEKR